MVVGRVYSIRSHLRPDLVYFGSTQETLARRLSQHRFDYKRFLAGNFHFITSFKLLELGDCYIELVEIVHFEEKSQLHAAESKCIRESECVNKFVPGRTAAEYHIDHKEKINERHAQYNLSHCDHLHAKHPCQCGGKFTTKNKSQHSKSALHLRYLSETT